MNRRDFIMAGVVGTVGLALPALGKSPKAKIKYLPANTLVVVNETHSMYTPLKRFGEGWPQEWQMLGYTNSVTKLMAEDSKIRGRNDLLVAELSLQKLDLKLTGVAINTAKVKQLMFVVKAESQPDKEMHFLSRSATLTRVNYMENKDTWEDVRYMAVFKPFEYESVPGLVYFDTVTFHDTH